MIAPLLAFDREGHRLGQGAGHYDRTLQGLRERGPVWVIGLAYAGQEIDGVPREPHDQPLDAILTETGYHLEGGVGRAVVRKTPYATGVFLAMWWAVGP